MFDEWIFVSTVQLTLFAGLFSLLCLFAAQWCLAFARRKSDRVSKQVKAVVFETTGDVSVLHSTEGDVQLEERFFEGVIGADRLFKGT